MSSLSFSSLDWKKTWDLNERNLDETQGYPSRVGWVVQRSGALEVFGSIGSFSGADHKVGFAIVSAKIPDLAGPEDACQITMDVSSETPEVVYTLRLVDRQLEQLIANGELKPGCTYQSDFRASRDRQKITFNASDFKIYSRGRLQEAARSKVDFSELKGFGVMVVRSRQSEADATEQPFAIRVYRAEFQ